MSATPCPHCAPLRTKAALLLGAARQYRAAEIAFNTIAQKTKGAGREFQAATAALVEARAVFDQLIEPVGSDG